MLIEDLIDKAHQANQQLIDSIAKDLKDAAVLAQLKNIPGIVTDSLQKIERLINQENQLKETLQSEMTRLRKLVESKIGLIAANSTDHLEKIQAIELLGKIANDYLTLYEHFYPQFKRKPISRWQDERLRLEQTVCKEKSISHVLEELLTAVNEMAEKKCIVPNQCFISYAWAGGETLHEKWVQPFLNSLRTHLMQAGVNTLLDIKDNLPGGSVFHYMNRIKDSDCVIVVGTESLFQQHKSGVDRACNELVLINQNRTQHRGKILPILLSGCFENSLPPYFLMYSNIIDWREYSYLGNLKQLIANIYEIGADNPEYQQKWTAFESQYPSLITGFPEEAIREQLVIEEKLKVQQKEHDNQQVMQWFNEMNLRMLCQPKISNISQEPLLTWSTLIQCVKSKYIELNKFKTIFGEAQEISNCYVNLAIVEEQEQKEKEKLLAKERGNQGLQGDESSYKAQALAKKELEREVWLNSYEEIHGAKTSISPQDIHKLQKGKTLNRQLILGRAGIGKSTLCQYLAYQWAKEGWWKDEPFKLLVWVPLRQLTNESIYLTKGNVITLGKLFYEQYEQQLRGCLVSGKERDWVHLIDKLIEENHLEILYLLDGFDEVAHVCQLDARHATRQTEILSQLLKQERVVITSRPYYIDNYLNTQGLKIDRRLENIGFIDKDIQVYVQRYFQEQPELKTTLQSLLNSNHLIKGIAHIPINLALLCRYWSKKTVKKDHYLTITDLYEGLVGNLLYEYLGKQSGKGTIDFKGECGEEVLENAEVQSILRFLEKLAFLQIQEDSLLISQERICALLKELKVNQEKSGFEKVLGTGLLVSPDSQEKRFEQKREHYFIHLTFQEFLAACYIARIFKQNDDSARTVAWLEGSHKDRKISSQPLALFMQNHKHDLRYEIMWWFVAGLLKNHREGINRFFNSLCSAPRSFAGWYDVLLLIKCLEESKLTSYLSGTLKKSLIEEIRKMALAALDRQARISDTRYSKTFFEYLYSSPMVYEALSILRTQEAVGEALDILRWHSNLPSSVWEKIAELLRDKDKKTKLLALRALGEQPNLSNRVLNEIVKLLLDEEWDVKRSALEALGQQQNLSESVLDEIVKLLLDKEGYVRISVLDALGQQQNLSDSVLDKVIKLLFIKNGDIRSSALNVLRKQQNLSDSALNKIVKLLHCKDWVVKSSALETLSQQQNLSESALNEIVELLIYEERDIRSSALNVLRKQQNLSDSVLNKIVRLLHCKDWVVKSLALEALGQQQNLSESVLDEIVKLLRDKEGDVRSSALDVLRKQQKLSGSVSSEIVNLLFIKDGNIRSSALYALGQQQNLSESVLDEIVKLLRDEMRYVRSSALYVLGQQQNLSESVLDEIVKLLRDEEGNVRSSALRALGKQQNLLGSVLDEIVKLLLDEKGDVKSSALYVLGQQQNLSESILKEIVKSLCYGNWNVSNSARDALGHQQNLSGSVLDEIVKLLLDEEGDVRSSALYILGQQQNLSESVLKEIVKLLRDEKEDVRSLARDALSHQQNLSESVLKEIVKLLRDESWYTRSLALQALEKQQNLLDSVLREVIALISDKKQVYGYYNKEISFINQQLVFIVDNSELKSQLYSTPALLTNVILQNVFSSKNVVYFNNNQSLMLQLGQQLREITIKNKNEFIRIFIEECKLWLNNQDTAYSLNQITNQLSIISLRESKPDAEQNVIDNDAPDIPRQKS